VICLSDLHDPDALQTLCRLGQRHDAVVVHLVDPAERGLEKAGFLRAREAETGRSFSAPASRVWADPEAAARELRRARVDHLELRTDRPFLQLLRRFFAVRGLLGRGAR
jgi:uncharacterized protein (DUF58 family)